MDHQAWCQELGGESVCFSFQRRVTAGEFAVHDEVSEFVCSGEAVSVNIVCAVG